MNRKQFEIAIIGGGPAGSTMAIRLARCGFKVCLVEKFQFPREVLCGEFLSKEVTEELKSLELYDKFLKLKPNKINSFRFINDDGKELETDFNFESFGMKRSIFDKFLIEEAKLSGAELIQPAEVKRIIYENSKHKLEVKTSNNEDILIDAGFVIAAYGKRNLLDKQLNRRFANERSGLNGIKFHIDKKFLPGFSTDRIDVYASEGIYCGLNAVSENAVTVCFLESRKDFSGSPIDHFNKLFSRNEKFSKLFSRDFNLVEIDVKVYGTGNIYFGKRELVKDGVFMIGDAARVIAPLAGDGIGMALESSAILSGILIESRKNNYPNKEIEEIHERNCNRNFRRRLIMAGFIQKMILQSKMKNIGIGIVNRIPGLLPILVRTTRG